MATRTKNRKKPVSKTTSKTAIPSAVREKKQPTASDMLAGLVETTSSKRKNKAKKVDRPVINLPKKVIKAIKALAPLKTISDIIKGRVDHLTDEVKEGCMDEYLNLFWESKTQPTNPSLAVEKVKKPDIDGTYIVQSRFKVQAESKEELIELLSDNGVERAEELVENEFDFTPEIKMRPFNELVNGHYENRRWIPATDQEKAIAQNLMSFVQGIDAKPFSPEERDLVLISTQKITVKKGFYERVCGYLGTLDELKAVFSIIQPTEQLRSLKFGLSDSLSAKHKRILTAVNSVLEEESEEE